jgi:hypothetical protein
MLWGLLAFVYPGKYLLPILLKPLYCLLIVGLAFLSVGLIAVLVPVAEIEDIPAGVMLIVGADLIKDIIYDYF